jgi:DedD protein
MERRFKERLIGAIILVALVVVLVPEILSGPHHGAAPPAPDPEPLVRTYTVDVAHIATAPPAPQPPRAASSAPEPAAVPIAPSAPAAAPVPALPSPVVRSPAAATGWTVQLGNFASKAHAETFVRQLKSEGFSAYIAPIGAGAAQRYRVRLGPIADRSTAAGIMATLRAHRHASTLLAPSQ